MSKTLNGVPFRQIWLPKEKYSIKAPFAMVWKKLTLHETDNMMDAEREIKYMISNTNQTSYHIAADENEIIQAIPFNRNAWHSGDGLNGYGNRYTIGWEMCRNYDRNRQTTQLLEPLSSQYKRTVQNTIKGAAQLFVDEGRVANNDNIKTHFDWSGKNCPRKARNDGQVLIIKAGIINEYNRLKGIKTKPIKVQTSKKVDGHLTLKQVVDRAIAGGYGNYPARVANIKNKTNYTYDQVQPEINKRFNQTTPKLVSKPAPSKPKWTTETVAQQIVAGTGEWGNGDTRVKNVKNAGLNPTTVQNRVNQILKDKSAKPKPAPAKPKYDAEKVAQDIAKGVGGWGNGATRVKKLEEAGLNPTTVQNRVNELLKVKPAPSKPKLTTEIVAQQIAKGEGGWGNGDTRVKNVKNAGLNPTTVQNRVNAILGAKSKPKSTSSGVKVGSTVTARRLYSNSSSTRNVRTTSIRGYVDKVNKGWRNEVRLRNKKGGYYIGFTRLEDIQ